MIEPNVLIIDDESDIRQVAQLGLELIGGWQVATASSGADGLAQASADRPDVILLDVMMPDIDGPETLRLLRADSATKAVPVVFLTAQPGQRRRVVGGVGGVRGHREAVRSGHPRG